MPKVMKVSGIGLLPGDLGFRGEEEIRHQFGGVLKVATHGIRILIGTPA